LQGLQGGLSFHWDAFDIEVMVEEKMTSSNFDGGCRHLALGLPSLGRWGQTRAPSYRPRRAGLHTSGTQTQALGGLQNRVLGTDLRA